MEKSKTSKKIFKWLVALLLLFLFTLLAFYIALQSPKFQTFIVKKVSTILSKNIGSELSIENVEIEFFNLLKFNQLFIEDEKKDTMVYISDFKANINYFSLFNNNLDLDNIEINGLVLNIDRAPRDSLFNFSFLIPNKKKKPKKIDKPNNWLVQLDQLTLNQSRIYYKDSLLGNIVYTSVPQLHVNFHTIDFNENKFIVEKVLLKEPDVRFWKTKNLKTSPSEEFDLKISSLLQSNLIEIDQARFNFINTLDTNNYNYMAYNNLQFREIDMSIKDLFLYKDSLNLKIDNFTAEENNGFALKEFSSELWLNNNSINLKQIHLKTNNSIFNAVGNLKYKSFKDFKDFDRKVRFNLDLKNTKIDSKDLIYFTNLKKIGVHGIFQINGVLKGKLSSLKARDIVLEAGKNTIFKGDFSLNGLPKIKETFISLRVNELKTNYYDLKYIHSKIPLPVNASKLGTIYFKGKFDGFYSDFVTFGEIDTDLGFAKTDINFKISNNGISSYSGNLLGKNLNLGKWFNQEQLIGFISLNTSIKGKGVTLNTLEASLKGNVEEITFKDYIYRNIVVDGSVKNNFFEGNAKVNDENLKMNFTGLVDASTKTPVFKFSSTVDKIDLKALNIIKEDYAFSGNINSNFSANNIDNIEGNLSIDDIKITKQGEVFNLNSLVLSSQSSEIQNTLHLKTDNLKLNVSGNYKISLLPKTLSQIFLSQEDKDKILNQKIKFDAEITDHSEIIKLLVPQLQIPEIINISGNLNTNTQSALASLSIPRVKYKQFEAINFVSNLYVKNGKIDLINSLPAIYMKDSLLLKDISFIADGTRNDLDFGVNMSYKKAISSMSLLGNLSFNNELFQLRLDTNSNILINNNFWQLAPGNLISFNKNQFTAEKFKVYTSTSQANIKVDQNNNTNNLTIDLQNINVGDFNDLLKEKGIDLQGKLNGELRLTDFDVEPKLSGELAFLKIYVNDYNIGDFHVNSKLDLPNKKVFLKGGLYSKENHIDIRGGYSLDKISSPKDIDIDVFIKQFTVKSLEDFIPEFISNSSGTVNGSLKLAGARTSPNLTGYVDVNDVTTTVSYTQVPYTIAGTRAIFSNNVIQLADRVTVQDNEGNVAIGTGKVTHENLRNWAIDFKINTSKIKALNTTINDNPDFHGVAYLNGGATFIGSTDGPEVYIFGESVENSHIDVPLVEFVSNKEYNFYSFLNEKKSIKEVSIEEKDQKQESVKIKGATVKLDLDIDEDLEMKIILDQEAGDVLKVKGRGNIKIDVGKKAEFVNFFGTYNVTKGNYLFTLQNIVNKPFLIEPNSKINFNGDIYHDATIDMLATYTRKIAIDDFIAEYLSAEDEELQNLAKNRVPVTLFLDLSDKLSKPVINFDIAIDRVDPKLRNHVDNKLQTLRINESELNNQIFGVLVLSRLLPSFTGLENSLRENSSGLVLNTVSELVGSQLSRYLTDWASYVVQDLEFYVNFSSYDPNYFSEETLAKRRELQLALSKRFFNDRLIINVGGNFDFGESIDQNTNNSNSTFIGANVNFEYALTNNRRWRIKAFTISDYDNFSSQRNRTTRSGVGLSYKREFNNLIDLFNIKSKPIDVQPNQNN